MILLLHRPPMLGFLIMLILLYFFVFVNVARFCFRLICILCYTLWLLSRPAAHFGSSTYFLFVSFLQLVVAVCTHHICVCMFVIVLHFYIFYLLRFCCKSMKVKCSIEEAVARNAAKGKSILHGQIVVNFWFDHCGFLKKKIRKFLLCSYAW